MEQFNQFNIVISTLKVLFQKDIDTGFKNECVVDSNHTNARRFVPARLSTTSDGGIHDVIRDQKEGLQLKKA